MFKFISSALLALLVVGCGSKAFVKGSYDQDINQANLLTDRWSESDMQNAVKALITEAKKHRFITHAKRPPIVMTTKIGNKTSEIIDTQSISDMMRVELMRGGQVQFIDKAAREDLAKEYEYQKENMSRTSKKKKGNQISADLIFNGRLDSIVQQAGRDKTVYYKLTLNMTNLSTGLIVWSDYKQIRKVFRKKRLGL